MKDINGNELQRGDPIIAVNSDGNAIVGTLHEFYDRTDEIRISGTPIRVKASESLLAGPVAAKLIKPELDKRAEAAKAAAQPPSQPTQPAIQPQQPLQTPDGQGQIDGSQTPPATP